MLINDFYTIKESIYLKRFNRTKRFMFKTASTGINKILSLNVQKLPRKGLS